MRLLLFHENAETMPQLAAALARHTQIEAVRIVNPGWYLRARAGRPAGFAWNELGAADWQRLAVVPGLRRLSGLSARILRRHARQAIEHARPDAVLIERPYLAPILAAVTQPVAYIAADAYRFYRWEHERTARHETVLLEQAQVVFAVAHRLIEDFQALGARNVVHLGSAVPEQFVEACRAPLSRPADLDRIPGPRVGCVGVINHTYDWDLISSLATQRPAVSFVFIGPIVEHDQTARRRINAVLARANVHWLGPRAHQDLPAYLAGFDALLNPLLVNDHSDRRFPLRLCEYVATDRPVLSTAIHELPWFPSDIVAFDRDRALERLDDVLRGQAAVDLGERATWLATNTWDARARTVIGSLETVLSTRTAPNS